LIGQWNSSRGAERKEEIQKVKVAYRIWETTIKADQFIHYRDSRRRREKGAESLFTEIIVENS